MEGFFNVALDVAVMCQLKDKVHCSFVFKVVVQLDNVVMQQIPMELNFSPHTVHEVCTRETNTMCARVQTGSGEALSLGDQHFQQTQNKKKKRNTKIQDQTNKIKQVSFCFAQSQTS